MSKKLTYCGQIVKQHDPDRFLLSLFAPVSARAGLWALFAFNHEIAKTREVVSETQLGLIRLQWWRDEITKLYNGGAPPENEILQALAEVIRTYTLPLHDFENLIYAREFDLEDVLPADMDGTIKYVELTNAPLLNLAVRICGGVPDMEPVNAVATNYGLVGLLRAVPFHASQRRCYLPEREIQAAGIRLNDLHEGRAVKALPALIEQVATYIDPQTKPDMRFLRAVQAHSVIYLKYLQRYGFDVHHPRMRVPPAFLGLRVYVKTFLP